MTARGWFVIKLGVAAALAAALATNGRLSIGTALHVLSDPLLCLVLIALQILILLLGVYRWRLILGALGPMPPYRSLLAWNWIGQFFGTVAPSSVATDATRFAYLRGKGGSTRVAATSLVVDRLCGIAGSVLVAVICGAGVIHLVFDVPTASSVVLPGVVVIGAGIALWRLRHRRRVRGAADQIHSGFVAACAMKRVAGTGIAIAALALLLKVATLWLIVHAVVENDGALSRIFTVAPIGFLAESLPLTPGGFGTAHLAFEYLFRAVGIRGGADYFNVYFFARLVTSLFGGVVWLACGARLPEPVSNGISRRIRSFVGV